jgi:hypothetical protein
MNQLLLLPGAAASARAPDGLSPRLPERRLLTGAPFRHQLLPLPLTRVLGFTAAVTACNRIVDFVTVGFS